jgi:hypothetical protein
MAKNNPASPVGEPLAQLELVHAELNRQIDATIDKHRTLFQRSSLLIGVATVVTGVQAGRIPAAIHSVGNLPAGWGEVHAASVLFAVLATAFSARTSAAQQHPPGLHRQWCPGAGQQIVAGNRRFKLLLRRAAHLRFAVGHRPSR